MKAKSVGAILLAMSRLSLAYSFVASFTTQQRRLSAVGQSAGWKITRGGQQYRSALSSTLEMIDRSSAYWFSVGDAVSVVEDVVKAGHNLKGRTGQVIETWEKCDVDPTCCCAENVDSSMNIRVEFQGTEETALGDGSFSHYFGEDELVKAKPIVAEKDDSQIPFDGLSCKAFKLDHLKMGEQAKRIAAFEASRISGDDE